MLQNSFRPALLTALSACLMLMVTSAQAGNNSHQAIQADEFLQAFDHLRADLEDGIPRQLIRSEWRDFNRIHEQIQSILEEADSTVDLPSKQQVALHSLQAEFSDMMMAGVQGQRVCAEQRQTGSRISRRNCRTLPEIEEDRRLIQDWLDSFPFQLEGPGS